VLIVDDNATNRMVLHSQLLRWGMLPIAVTDGASALEAIASSVATNSPFTVVIIDGIMPGMDGLALAQQIKREATGKEPTLMMLSSMGHAEADARQSGFQFCLTKPVRHSDLFDAVMTAVGQRASPSGPTRHQPGRLTPRRPLKILLAEDHPVNQRLAVAILQNWGHTVSVAANGKKAVEAFSREPFDLIVMDVQMPELNGLEATRTIRRMEQTTGGHIFIVAMTAHAFKGDREQCLAAGMDGYVSKPINSNDLFTTIESLFDGNAARNPQPAEPVAVGSHFDPALLMDRVGGDVQLLKEVLHLFFEDAEKSVETIGHALSRDDAAEVERAAHRLKGALSSMELRGTADLAAQLEQMGQSRQLAGAHQLMRDIASNIAQARPALEALTRQRAA
jgi:CheY-like chemotaxis protein